MMILLPGITKTLRDAVKRNPSRWGWLATPRRRMLSVIPQAPALFAVDNDCYNLGDSFDPEAFERLIVRLQLYNDRCLFVAAQDVLGDARATLNLLPGWSDTIRRHGFPVALVGQDGMENYQVPWSLCDAFFVGGTTEFKLGPGARSLIHEAKAAGKWVHMGRVNSAIRLRYGALLGVDSIDGTEWAINPGRGIRWATRALNELEAQMALAL